MYLIKIVKKAIPDKTLVQPKKKLILEIRKPITVFLDDVMTEKYILFHLVL